MMILSRRSAGAITPLTLLVILAIGLHIPSLFEPYWYGDEAIYLSVGEGLRQGLLLYRDIFDHKTPLIYLLAAITGSIFWFKFALLVSNAITVIVFWKLAKNLFGEKEKATILATLMFVLLSSLPLLEGNIANAELFILGPTLGAYLLLNVPRKTSINRAFLAGLLFSISILFKVPAIFDLLVVVAFWLISVKNGGTPQRTFSKILILLAGVSIPILISMVYFAWHHALDTYLTTAWSDNFTYIGRWGSVTAQKTFPPLNGLPMRALAAGLVLSLIFAFRKFFTPAILFVSIWLTLSLFAALISARPYPHYLIQAVPPFCLAITIIATNRLKVRFLPLPFVFLTSLAILYYNFSYYPVFPYYQNFALFVLGQKTRDQYINHFDSRLSWVYKLSANLQSRISLKERVFIWGTAPEVYALSRRLPPAKYITSFHITDFNGEKETLETLNKNKPKYIVILPEEKRQFPGFFPFLQNNYYHVENIEKVQIWKLKPNTTKLNTKL